MLIECSLIISSCCLFFHRMLLMELIITLHLYYNDDDHHSSNGCWLAAIFLCRHIVLSFVVDPSSTFALSRMTPQLAIWIPSGSSNLLCILMYNAIFLTCLFILYYFMLLVFISSSKVFESWLKFSPPY